MILLRKNEINDHHLSSCHTNSCFAFLVLQIMMQSQPFQIVFNEITDALLLSWSSQSLKYCASNFCLQAAAKYCSVSIISFPTEIRKVRYLWRLIKRIFAQCLQFFHTYVSPTNQKGITPEVLLAIWLLVLAFSSWCKTFLLWKLQKRNDSES